MKIEREEDKTAIMFKELEIGDVFEYNENIFLKTENLWRRSIENTLYNCIRLSDACAYNIPLDVKVKKVDAVLKITD